jgi:hypothetical protein
MGHSTRLKTNQRRDETHKSQQIGAEADETNREVAQRIGGREGSIEIE